jgi:hypothetical protein
MDPSKTNSGHSIKDLLAIVMKSNPPPGFSGYRARTRSAKLQNTVRYVGSWLKAAGIESGEKSAKASDLYKAHCEYQYRQQMPIPSRTAFGLAIKDFLKKQRKNFGIIYKVNKAPAIST